MHVVDKTSCWWWHFQLTLLLDFCKPLVFIVTAICKISFKSNMLIGSCILHESLRHFRTASDRNTEEHFHYIASVINFVWLSGRVVGCWSCDRQVASSNPSLSAVECNPGQVVNTHVPLSPSSIIWYQPMGGDALQHGKVTVGLASHWPRVTNISGSPPTGSWARRGRWAPAYALLVE